MTGQTYKLQHFTCNASMIKIRPHNDGFSSNYILLGGDGWSVYFIFKFHHNYNIHVWYSYTLPKLACCLSLSKFLQHEATRSSCYTPWSEYIITRYHPTFTYPECFGYLRTVNSYPCKFMCKTGTVSQVPKKIIYFSHCFNVKHLTLPRVQYYNYALINRPPRTAIS